MSNYVLSLEENSTDRFTVTLNSRIYAQFGSYYCCRYINDVKYTMYFTPEVTQIRSKDGLLWINNDSANYGVIELTDEQRRIVDALLIEFPTIHRVIGHFIVDV